MTMTNQTDGGGGSGGGGTPLSICAISPTDTESTLWNFLKRIEELEKAVSQMLGGNVSAGQLSDISQQVGWVYGVTYMGVPGWTQTEYGTLIPPAGFSLSSVGFPMYNACTGEYESYQGVSVDSDGVLQFGFTASGGLCGEQVQSWSMGGDPPRYAYSLLGNYSFSSGGVTGNPGFPTNDTAGSVGISITEAGLYEFSINGTYTANTDVGANSVFATRVRTVGSVGGAYNSLLNHSWQVGSLTTGGVNAIPDSGAAGVLLGSFNFQTVYPMPASSSLDMYADAFIFGGSMPASAGFGHVYVSATRIGAIP